MPAASHLAKLGVTIQQARDFILLNIDQPKVIYDTAFDNGVTTLMLSEISDFPMSAINEYFVSYDLDPEKLDDTSILINSDSDLDTLENLVAFNDNTGILSTTSLREKVQPLLNDPFFYDFIFDPVFDFQTNDGIYDAEELGVTHLNNVPATNESIESLFYGTLINIYLTFDEAEFIQLNGIVGIGNRDESKELIVNALTSVPSSSTLTDEALAEIVIDEAANLFSDFLEDNSVIGVLDHSFLGFAIA